MTRFALQFGQTQSGLTYLERMSAYGVCPRGEANIAVVRIGKSPPYEFDLPGGGYFIWVTLPSYVDTAALLARADEYKVAYLPGGRVSLDGANHHALRLSFALMKPAQLADGARRLGALLADSLN